MSNHQLRAMREIQSDIEQERVRHNETIAKLQEEILQFQSRCPHPAELINNSLREEEDQYSYTEGYTLISECLACGAKATDYMPRERYALGWKLEYPTIGTRGESDG